MKKEDKELLTAILNAIVVVGMLIAASRRGMTLTEQDILGMIQAIKMPETN